MASGFKIHDLATRMRDRAPTLTEVTDNSGPHDLLAAYGTLALAYHAERKLMVECLDEIAKALVSLDSRLPKAAP